jgi:hypothetical protein
MTVLRMDPKHQRHRQAQRRYEARLRAGIALYLTPLGSANEIKHLLQDCQLVSNNCPINVHGQAWTLMTENHAHARCAGDCRRIARGKRCANKYPTLARAKIPTQHIFGVFLSRQES